MSERLKIFLLVALFGFVAGVIAQLAADYAIPWLVAVVPALVQIRFLVSGLAGACLTLVLLSVWAYVTGPTHR
jgi:phage shock protein PspC (stress-responsive transcriptional regulator)